MAVCFPVYVDDLMMAQTPDRNPPVVATGVHHSIDSSDTNRSATRQRVLLSR